jgi:hypothetical protein
MAVAAPECAGEDRGSNSDLENKVTRVLAVANAAGEGHRPMSVIGHHYSIIEYIDFTMKTSKTSWSWGDLNLSSPVLVYVIG